jgi:hypothetical protein
MSRNKYNPQERKLKVTWDDPLIGAATSKTMAEGKLVDQEGKLSAHGTITFVIFDPKGR